MTCSIGCARPAGRAHPLTSDYLTGLTVNEVEALLEQVENFFLSITALL